MSIRSSKRNYGFDLLRIFLAFEVVLSHFCYVERYDGWPIWLFREMISFTIPCFVVLSFYLTEKTFVGKDEGKKKNRLMRLIVPQIYWSVIYFLIIAFLGLIFPDRISVNFTDFLWQLAFGHSAKINASMWYQFDMIVITVLFIIIFNYLGEKKGIISIIMLSIFAYIMQYSGINYSLFGSLRFELKYPFGRILELLPFAAFGLLLRYYDVLNKLSKYRYIVIPMCAFMFLYGFNIDWHDFQDFGNGNICKLYFAFFVIAFAYVLPLEYFEKWIEKPIEILSKYTMGIYCMHRLLGTVVGTLFPGIRISTFIASIIIYVVCYLICMILSRFKSKTINQLID